MPRPEQSILKVCCLSAVKCCHEISHRIRGRFFFQARQGYMSSPMKAQPHCMSGLDLIYILVHLQIGNSFCASMGIKGRMQRPRSFQGQLELPNARSCGAAVLLKRSLLHRHFFRGRPSHCCLICGTFIVSILYIFVSESSDLELT